MLLSFNDFINSKLLLEKKEKEIEPTKRLISVVSKDFFSELKEHLFYWFNYQLKDDYELTSLEATKDDVTIWFNDVDEVLQYKVIYNHLKDSTALTQTPDVVLEKIEQVKMIVNVYDFNTSDLLKTMEIIVGIKMLNSKSFKNFCNKVKNRIILKPETQEDIKDFDKKETRILKDNIY